VLCVSDLERSLAVELSGFPEHTVNLCSSEL